MCYNGRVEDALIVANYFYDNLWISDEEEMHEIINENGIIVFRVLDVFTFADVDASEDEIEDFITEYLVTPCN